MRSCFFSTRTRIRVRSDRIKRIRGPLHRGFAQNRRSVPHDTPRNAKKMPIIWAIVMRRTQMSCNIPSFPSSCQGDGVRRIRRGRFLHRFRSVNDFLSGDGHRVYGPMRSRQIQPVERAVSRGLSHLGERKEVFNLRFAVLTFIQLTFLTFEPFRPISLCTSIPIAPPSNCDDR